MAAEARTTISARGDEIGRPLNRRPLGSETTQWTTTKAKGILQQVEVMVRDRDTNEVLAIPYSVVGTRSITRQAAIDAALGHITPEGTDGDRQQILGAVYVATIVMTPGG